MSYCNTDSAVYQQDEDGLTLLHHTAIDNWLKTAKSLFFKYRVDPNLLAKEGYTPLDFAVERYTQKEDNIEFISLLLQQGATLSPRIKSKVAHLKPELLKRLVFVSVIHPTTMESILDALAQQNYFFDPDNYMQLLYRMACAGSDQFITLLSKKPCFVTHPDKHQKLLIHYLAQDLLTVHERLQHQPVKMLEDRKRHTQAAIHYLIREGSDINKLDANGITAQSLLKKAGPAGQAILKQGTDIYGSPTKLAR